MLNVPNILTMIRLALIGVFVYLYLVPKNYLLALIVFVVAAMTDVLDGYIARKTNQITDFGKLMDPLADKLMLVAALVCLSLTGNLPLIFLVFVVIKELLLIAGGIYLYRRKVVVYAKVFGKISTFLFNTGVGLSVLTLFFPWVAPWHIVCLTVAVIAAAAAFVQYSIVFIKAPKDGDPKKQEAEIAGCSVKSADVLHPDGAPKNSKKSGDSSPTA